MYEDKVHHSYEIVWENGHVEIIRACQVSWPNNAARVLHGQTDKPDLINVHAVVDGQWTLVAQFLQDDIASIRNLDATEFSLEGHGY